MESWTLDHQGSPKTSIFYQQIMCETDTFTFSILNNHFHCETFTFPLHSFSLLSLFFKTGMYILFNVALLMYNWHTNCTVSIFINRKRSSKYFKGLLELVMLLKVFLIHPNYHYRGIVNIWLLLREVSTLKTVKGGFPCRLWDNMVIQYPLPLHITYSTKVAWWRS